MNIFEDDRIKFLMLCIIIVLQVITVSTIILCSDCFNNVNEQDSNSEIAIVEKNEEKESVTVDFLSNVRVDVKGAVKKSGVYELDSNSRVIDAINLGNNVGEVNPQSNIAKAYKKIANDILNIDFSTLKTNAKYHHGIFNLLKKMGEE